MAWYQKGLSKEEKECCDVLVAKGFLDFLKLSKDSITKEGELRILCNVFDLAKKSNGEKALGKVKYNVIKKLIDFSRKYLLTKRHWV